MDTLLNKVAIVDDDPTVLRVLTAYLKASGYEVYAASAGLQALELVEQHQPSYFIMDWEMPGMNGLELCRRARKLELSGYLYIIFLTARSGIDDLVAAMDAGADDFLNKPLNHPELTARLSAGARVLRLESRLSQLVAHDALTELFTRRALGEYLSKECARSRRYRLPLSVVMLDIDFFKRINDTYGHPAGDQVIRTVATLLQQHSRKSNIVCRYGGEEFVVLLPETDETSAAAWAERLRCRVADTVIPFGEARIQITVSLGVTEMLAEIEDKDELLALADQCLLEAKEQGRNRVVSVKSLIDSGGFSRQGGSLPQCGLETALARDAMVPLIHCLHADWPIERAAAYFLHYRISSVPVTDEQGALLGILSEKDVLTVAHTAEAMQRRVGDVMRSNVIVYKDTAPLLHILNFLIRASMRSVVISAEGKPCGLVSRASLVRWFLENPWRDQRTQFPLEQVHELQSDATRPLALLAGNLVELAHQLHDHLLSDAGASDPAPIVGGATRMQGLLDDLLCGSACESQIGGGLPF